MKVVEVRFIFDFLSRLNLSKFDKDVRHAILKNYMDMYSCYKENESKIEELKKKIFTEEDLIDIQTSFKDKTPLNKELADKNNEYNIILSELFNSEYDIKITKISEEKFINGLSDLCIDYTPLDIIRLKPILE